MKEYIEREAALETTYEPFTMSMCMTVSECNGMNRAREMIFKQLRDIPAADVVEVRHGKWVWDGGVGMHYYCSLCHHNAYGNTGEIMDGEYKYCPNCGAKMDGERKEVTTHEPIHPGGMA